MRIRISHSGVEQHISTLEEEKKYAARLRAVLRQISDLAQTDSMMDGRTLQKCLENAGILEKSIQDKINTLDLLLLKMQQISEEMDQIREAAERKNDR